MTDNGYYRVPQLGEFPALGVRVNKRPKLNPRSSSSSTFAIRQRTPSVLTLFMESPSMQLSRIEKPKLTKIEGTMKNTDNLSTASLPRIRARGSSNHRIAPYCGTTNKSCCGPDEKLLAVYYDEGAYKTIVVNEKMRAIDVCKIMLKKCLLDENDISVNWQLYEEVEALPNYERQLEDHEFAFDLGDRWPGLGSVSRIWFRPNPSKYSLSDDMERLLLRSDELQMTASQPNSIKTRPIFEGIVWLKRPNCKWIKVLCFLVMSAVFFTKKSVKKNARFLVDLVSMDMFVCRRENDSTKAPLLLDHAPTPYSIVLVPSSIGFLDTDAIYVLATKSRAELESWAEGLRLHKHGRRRLEINLANAVEMDGNTSPLYQNTDVSPQVNWAFEYFNLEREEINTPEVAIPSLEGVLYEDGFPCLYIQTTDGLLKQGIDVVLDSGEHCFRLQGFKETFSTLDELSFYYRTHVDYFKFHALAHQDNAELNSIESSSF